MAHAAAGKLDYPQALGHIRRAIELSQELCERNPSRPFFKNQLGYCLHTKGNILESAGDLAGAAGAYEQALRIKQELCGLDIPELSNNERQVALPVEVTQFQLSLARVEMHAGEMSPAEENLRRSLGTLDQLATSYPALYYVRVHRHHVQRELGELYLATGRIREAREAFNRRVEMIRQIATDFPAEREHTALYLIDAVCYPPPQLVDEPEKHLALARELLGKPRNDGDWLYLGALLFRQGKIRESIAALEENRQSRDASTCFFLAMAYSRADDPQRARRCYEEAITRLGRQREPAVNRLRREAAEALGIVAPPPRPQSRR